MYIIKIIIITRNIKDSKCFQKNILNNLLIFLAENGYGDNGRWSFWRKTVIQL